MLIYCPLRYRPLFDCAAKTFPLFLLECLLSAGRLIWFVPEKKY